MIDIKAVTEQAKKEINEARSKKAVEALKRKYNDLENAKQVVKNIEREIEDLTASIGDGSFTA